ncbi:MAG: hypothetical protein IJX08_00075 [Clostridia bacterium]|nr:hypothetical protein [Clostridia bacterium]
MKNQNLLNKKSCLVLVLILLLLLNSCSAVSSTSPQGSESAPASSPSAEAASQKSSSVEGSRENPYDPKPEGTLMIPPSEDAEDARYDKFYYNVEHQEGQRKIESVFYGIDNPSQEEGSRLMVSLRIICQNGACPDLIARSENVESRNQGSKTIYTIYYWSFGSAELKELSLDENVTSIEFFQYGYECSE